MDKLWAREGGGVGGEGVAAVGRVKGAAGGGVVGGAARGALAARTGACVMIDC